jgi:hypothetical protein
MYNLIVNKISYISFYKIDLFAAMAGGNLTAGVPVFFMPL